MAKQKCSEHRRAKRREKAKIARAQASIKRRKKKQTEAEALAKAAAPPSLIAPRAQPTNYLLEVTSEAEIEAQKKRAADELKYHWDLYSELAFQRAQHAHEIRDALASSSTPFEFRQWIRAVKFVYSLHPFCTLGSTRFDGGRFNVGSIDPQRYAKFGAIYVASDRDTALQELLGQVPPDADRNLTPQQIVLSSRTSTAEVAVNGVLDYVLDLRVPNVLDPFVAIIKDFEISSKVAEAAAALGLDPPGVLTNSAIVLESFLSKEWRKSPTVYNIPANSQIFGSLLVEAGVQGVIYPSKLTGKACIAIFPDAFAYSAARIELDGPMPHPNVPTPIDCSNYSDCERMQDEVIARPPRPRPAG